MDAYPPGAPADPTAVLGRRYAAFVLDGLLAALLTAVAVLAFGGVTEQQGGRTPDRGGGRGVDQGGSTYSVEDAAGVALYLVPLAYGVLFAVVGQGVTGATPGKAAFGVRVVDARGGGPGVGRSLVRTLLLPVDLIGCGLPLVGPVTSFTSRGHRRVGDMVAGTFVVDRAAAGRPVAAAPPTATAPPSPGPVAPSLGPGDRPPAPPVPVWDPARGAYVVWDPSRSRWLVHDPTVGLWRDL